MNRLLFSVFLISISVCSYGQNQEQTSDLLKMTETDSLYLTAIQKYTDELNSFYQENPGHKNSKIVYVLNEDYLLRLPKKVNGYKVQKLDKSNRQKYFKENKNKLELVEISSLAIEDGRFKIALIPYSAELKRRNRLNLSLSDWMNIYFQYEDGKLIFKETKRGGI